MLSRLGLHVRSAHTEREMKADDDSCQKLLMRHPHTGANHEALSKNVPVLTKVSSSYSLEKIICVVLISGLSQEHSVFARGLLLRRKQGLYIVVSLNPLNSTQLPCLTWLIGHGRQREVIGVEGDDGGLQQSRSRLRFLTKRTNRKTQLLHI